MLETRRLLHISDVHFGRIYEPALLYLKQFIAEQSNNLNAVVVSGDWTQRARSRQFQQAVDFIGELRVPVISVPGNHDIPLYNLWLRFLNPYRNYRKYIEPVTQKNYVDEVVAVFGITTVNRFAVKDGVMKTREVEQALRFFHDHPTKTKILVCHHPPVGAISELSRQGLHVDLILSGHTHACEVGQTSFPSAKKVVMASCGTSTSSRLRDEPNGFNYLEVSSHHVKVESYQFLAEGPRAEPTISRFEFEK